MRQSPKTIIKRFFWIVPIGGLGLVLSMAALAWALTLFADASGNPRYAIPPNKHAEPADSIPEVRPLGEPALDCSLYDVDGCQVHLKDFKGQMPVVVEFGGFT
jgi:hypothetical protein